MVHKWHTWSTALVFLIKCAEVWQNTQVAWFTLLYRQNSLKVWQIGIWIHKWVFEQYTGGRQKLHIGRDVLPVADSIFKWISNLKILDMVLRYILQTAVYWFYTALRSGRQPCWYAVSATPLWLSSWSCDVLVRYFGQREILEPKISEPGTIFDIHTLQESKDWLHMVTSQSFSQKMVIISKMAH